MSATAMACTEPQAPPHTHHLATRNEIIFLTPPAPPYLPTPKTCVARSGGRG